MADLDFEAVIEAGPGGGALVRLPADAAEVFGTRARVAITATFDGVAYRGSTMPMGDGTSCLGMQKAIRAELGKSIGDTVHVVIERDVAERTVDVPADLADALDQARLTSRFAAMAYSHRRRHVQAINEAKRPETRSRRIASVIDDLRKGDGKRG